MKPTTKAAVRDPDLKAEAFWFRDFSKPFPAHFHPYYVLGLVEAGGRKLVCRGREVDLEAGDLVIFQPGDSHACGSGGEPLVYRSINLPAETLQKALSTDAPPRFSGMVIQDPEAARRLRVLFRLIWERASLLAKEEALLPLLERLSDGPAPKMPDCRAEVEAVCGYIHRNYAGSIGMDALCRQAGLSGSALLRAFTRAKGITPYRYLEAVRVSEAKSLLEQGVPPAETALRAGFSDQSHFTNRFTRLMGLPPGAYQASCK